MHCDRQRVGVVRRSSVRFSSSLSFSSFSLASLRSCTASVVRMKAYVCVHVSASTARYPLCRGSWLDFSRHRRSFVGFVRSIRACVHAGSHLVLGYLGSLACLSVLGLWKVTLVLFLSVLARTPPFWTALAAFFACSLASASVHASPRTRQCPASFPRGTLPIHRLFVSPRPIRLSHLWPW